MKRIITSFLSLYFLIVLAGCTLNYVPKPSPIEPQKIPELNVKQPVKLVNVQTLDSKIALSVNPYTVNVNLHDYTDTVIALIKGGLQKKEVSVLENAEKVINLAVIDVGMSPLSGSFKCDLSFTVEMEGTPLFGMEVSAQNWDFQKAIDLTIAEAAVWVLNDERIIQYLEK
jgi:hypothetical protein